MKVAEKDIVVHGMLEDEYGRCREVIEALLAKMANYPRGALNVRRKQNREKEYVYHYLVRRDGKQVINDERMRQVTQVQRFGKETGTCPVTTSFAHVAVPQRKLNLPFGLSS
ncbi:MAG TPA: hypothetical protein VF318_06415 [Dehalococcoidales bacterium]